MNRRQWLKNSSILISSYLAINNGWAKTLPQQQAQIAATWRGADVNSTFYAGILAADFINRQLTIITKTPLPSRAHGINQLTNGNILICGVRPGNWLMQFDSVGKIIKTHTLDQQLNEGNCRLSGHSTSTDSLVFTSETNWQTGKGVIGVRDIRNLEKIAVWDSHGIDPHQIVLSKDEKILYIANGGVKRNLADRKVDPQQIDSSLVAISTQTGEKLGQWHLADSQLSMRHMQWNNPSAKQENLLGIALQAEHTTASEREKSPILAIFDGQSLQVIDSFQDNSGYSGDIVALNDGFILSSNASQQALLWQARYPQHSASIIKMKETYALTSWLPYGINDGQNGALIATAVGLVRWHPTISPIILAWPETMTIDNHWQIITSS